MIMKTKLLSFTLMTMLFSSITIAQTKVWDFGNDQTTWPVASSSIGGNTQDIRDNLGMYSSNPNASSPITNFGAITTNNATFSDNYTSTHRFQLNGAGYTSSGGFSAMPTQRFIFFDVSGACTIKVWFKTGSGGTTRTLYVTNGTTTIGSMATNSGSNTDTAILTVSAPAAGKYYIFADQALNLSKLSVVGATVNTTLANNDFQTSQVKVYSTGSQVYLSNIISKTQVEVYTITGALVNSISTEADTNFGVPTAGVYIVNVKSAEGKKSVKLVVQ